MMEFIVGSIAAIVVIAACIGSASAADGVEKIKQGTKDIGGKIADTAKDAKDGTVDGTKKAGTAVADKYRDIKEAVLK